MSPELKILSFRLALQVVAWAGFHGEGKCKFLSTPRSCTSPCFPPLSSCQHEIALPPYVGEVADLSIVGLRISTSSRGTSAPLHASPLSIDT